MKARISTNTAMICTAAVIVVALLSLPHRHVHLQPAAWIAIIAVIALGLGLRFVYVTTAKRAQLELTGSEQYRRLAEEYRRLADLAITAQEHTDLKLGDVNVQLDYLRQQNESLQKILREVE